MVHETTQLARDFPFEPVWHLSLVIVWFMHEPQVAALVAWEIIRPLRPGQALCSTMLWASAFVEMLALLRCLRAYIMTVVYNLWKVLRFAFCNSDANLTS